MNVQIRDWQFDNLLRFARETGETLSKLPQTTTRESLRLLIENFLKVAEAFYSRGIELLYKENLDSPAYQRHRIIKKITNEWYHIMTLLTTNELLPENHAKRKLLQRVIFAAWRDLNLEGGRSQLAILPQINRQFEQLNFRYSPQIAVIGIPLANLYAPWSWSEIWHEVAGILIQEKGKELVGKLADVVPDLTWQKWLIRFSIPDSPPPDPDGKIKETWLQEFLEDSVSVLCLGDHMITVLKDVLAQYYPADLGDAHHPHPPLRIELAKGLCYRMGLSEQDTDDEDLRHLATAIYRLKRDLVNRSFVEKDKDAADLLANSSLSGTASADDSSQDGTIDAFLLIVASYQAQQKKRSADEQKIAEELIGEFVGRRLKAHRGPSPTLDGTAYLTDTLDADAIKRIATWDELISLKFSVIDRSGGTGGGCSNPNGIPSPCNADQWGYIVPTTNCGNCAFPNGYPYSANNNGFGMFLPCS